MGSSGFRSRWTIGLSLIDLVCHVTLSLILPGPFWFQFLPDLLVLPLWLHGYLTDRMLPATNPFIIAHRSLHSIWPIVLLISVAIFTPVDTSTLIALAGLHWAAHLLVDLFTHRGDLTVNTTYPFVFYF